jgi:serine phosphatase RsbU (regulator of sigma subunit)
VSRPVAAPSPLRELVGHLWRGPLLAIPFALFFVVIFGGMDRGGFWPALWTSYRIALTFAFSVSLTLWAAFNFTPLQRIRDSSDRDRGALVRTIGAYLGTSILGSAVGSALVHLFVLPGFLGGGRQIGLVAAFTLLFAVLFLALAFALQYHRASVGRARAEEELNLARRIQESFFVRDFPALERLDVHAVNVSSREVSGDFYDFVPAGPGRWLVAIADVTGKGVPAALLSSMLQASLRTQAGSEESPARIVANMNRLAYRSTHTDQFATFFMARLDEGDLSLAYTNAGHNPPLVVRRGGTLEMLETGGVIVGILEEFPYAEDTIRLNEGDLLFAYTDGVTEAMGPAGEFYGEERLHPLLASLPAGTTAKAAVERVLADVERFLDGRECGDDLTLLAIRLRPATHRPASS